MWAVGELGLAHQRIDVGGQFGGNDQADYRAKNPNGLVPTLEDGDFILWESNSIIRYLAESDDAGKIRPATAKSRGLASQWMDWQLSVFQPVFTPTFWGLVRTPPEKRDNAAIAQSKTKSIDAAKMLEAALARRPYVAGESFSMGDIPMGVMIYRFRQLVPERPSLPNIERWFAAVEKRPAFHAHVGGIALT
jgi:glutathione S-transferase